MYTYICVHTYKSMKSFNYLGGNGETWKDRRERRESRNDVNSVLMHKILKNRTQSLN